MVWNCHNCGNLGIVENRDENGYYCLNCGSKVEEIKYNVEMKTDNET